MIAGADDRRTRGNPWSRPWSPESMRSARGWKSAAVLLPLPLRGGAVGLIALPLLERRMLVVEPEIPPREPPPHRAPECAALAPAVWVASADPAARVVESPHDGVHVMDGTLPAPSRARRWTSRPSVSFSMLRMLMPPCLEAKNSFSSTEPLRASTRPSPPLARVIVRKKAPDTLSGTDPTDRGEPYDHKHLRGLRRDL